MVWFPAGHPGASKLVGRFAYSARRDVRGPADFPFFTRDHHLIQQLELLAAAAVYSSFPPDFFAGREVIHFIDNVGALSGLIRGVANAIDSLAIVRAFHMANMALRADVWFNYVASKANVADLPSRWDLHALAGVLRTFSPPFCLGADRVDLVTPECFSDIPSMWAAVAARLGVPDSAPPGHPPRASRAAPGPPADAPPPKKRRRAAGEMTRNQRESAR